MVFLKEMETRIASLEEEIANLQSFKAKVDILMTMMVYVAILRDNVSELQEILEKRDAKLIFLK